MKELSEIQAKLVAPKGQYNNFGKYAYRNAEDILSALKPQIEALNVHVTLTDDMVAVVDRIYVKATATITNEAGETVSTVGWAREALQKKGMDESQITGSASSYARKYALNGLFAIDDTKDADSMDNRQAGAKQQGNKQGNKQQQTQAKNPLNSKFGAVAKQYQNKHSLTEEEIYSQISNAFQTNIANFYAFNKLNATQKNQIIEWLNQGIN